MNQHGRYKFMLKKIWHWLRMEDENGKPLDDNAFVAGINDFRYSKCIEKFPLKERMTLDDILHISHKKSNGDYETCYITLKQLKDALDNL